MITYNVIQLPIDNQFELNDSLFITKRSSDDPKVISIDLNSNGYVLGYYDKNQFTQNYSRIGE